MAVEEGMGDGMQCINHPFNKNPGGICAICLQEKLGKLVSSSNFPIHESFSSSSSFRSNSVGSCDSGAGNLSFSVAKSGNNSKSEAIYGDRRNERPPKLPFLLAKKKKKETMMKSSYANRTAEIVYKRSKSVKTPRRAADGQDFSARKRSGFWSFLHISPSRNQSNNRADVILARKNQSGLSESDRIEATRRNSELGLSGSERIEAAMSNSGKGLSKRDEIEAGASNSGKGLPKRDEIEAAMSNSGQGLSKSERIEATITQPGNVLSSSLSKKEVNSHNCSNLIVEEEDGSSKVVSSEAAESGKVPSFETKVSRSRSVGCGSRSFSSDFFGKISNGFGDCALRRVESQREGKRKVSSNNSKQSASSGMRDLIRCGGIFGGFLIMSSTSSSSSSTSFSSADHHHHQHHVNGRNRSWGGWAFASPLRASSYNKSSSSSSLASSAMEAEGTNVTALNNKNRTADLDAIPSLLAVRS